jgi:hypothetical protein
VIYLAKHKDTNRQIDLWWALWGFFLGFLIQTMLFLIGVYSFGNTLTVASLFVVIIFFIVLAIFGKHIISKKKNKKETIRKRLNDREFQLEIESVKGVADSFNAFLLSMIAVAITWVTTLVALSSNNALKGDGIVNLLANAIEMIFVIIGIVGAFVIFNYMYVPWKLRKIGEQNSDLDPDYYD